MLRRIYPSFLSASLLVIGCASQLDKSSSSDEMARAELQAAIQHLCQVEADCAGETQEEVEDCQRFMWDVAEQSYPRPCYYEAAAYALCLSERSCEEMAEHPDEGCESESYEVRICMSHSDPVLRFSDL